MGYKLDLRHQTKNKIFLEEDLKVILKIYLKWIRPYKMCTHRPSLFPKGKISRNIVDVVETVSQNEANMQSLLHRERRNTLILPLKSL